LLSHTADEAEFQNDLGFDFEEAQLVSLDRRQEIGDESKIQNLKSKIARGGYDYR
jgi:anti-sigma28 factor (negative regulator of flagellin synthesis)